MLRATIPSTIEIKQTIEAENSIIIANATQIHQILVNLCTNGVHAIGEEKGLIEVQLSEIDVEQAIHTKFGIVKKGAYVKLSVKDNGCGMESNVLERIFDPFFTTKDINKGTGLGLSVVHGIVKSSGGAITVDSKSGEETTFNLYFPRTENITKENGRAIELIFGNSESILVVDDEKSLVNLMVRTIGNLGYTVTGTTSCNEALKMFRDEPDKFGLVITDKTMPEMTGIEMAEQLTQLRPELPIILCTGSRGTVDPEKVKAAGIRKVVMKPFDKQEFSTVISKILNEKLAIA